MSACALSTFLYSYAVWAAYVPTSFRSRPKSIRHHWHRVAQGQDVVQPTFFRPSRLFLEKTLTSLTPDANERMEYGRKIAGMVQPSVALVTPIGVRNMTARGSGFAVDFPNSDNNEIIYLLTSAHVAAPGRRVEVTFPSFPTTPDLLASADPRKDSGNVSTTTHPATVVGRDMKSDLALLQITQTEPFDNPPVLKLVDDDNSVQIGTLAFAHGYPGGVDGAAMTSGIVCAFSRGLSFNDQYVENSKNTTNEEGDVFSSTSFVVTDAAMAGGMSGGPLVDGKGTVIGVNALVRPDLRALGNYAVAASECRSFLQGLATQMESPDNAVGDLSGADVSSRIATYRVVLYNDQMNTRARICKVLKEVAMLDEKASNKVMMAAHTKGSGTVREFAASGGGRADADILCAKLREQDVLAEVEVVFLAQT